MCCIALSQGNVCPACQRGQPLLDSYDHQILLDRLHMFGIRGNAHKWMQSYLSQRSQVVNIRDTRSRCVQLPCGVPQGSVLGPLLFSIYCIELSSVFESHQLSYHIYADDSQLYVEFPRDQPAQAVAAANRLSRCITDVRAWLLLNMCDYAALNAALHNNRKKKKKKKNNLMLNRDKTEAIVIAAVNTRAHATVDVVVDVCGCIVTRHLASVISVFCLTLLCRWPRTLVACARWRIANFAASPELDVQLQLLRVEL